MDKYGNRPATPPRDAASIIIYKKKKNNKHYVLMGKRSLNLGSCLAFMYFLEGQ